MNNQSFDQYDAIAAMKSQISGSATFGQPKKPEVDKTKLEASKAEKKVVTANNIIVTKDGDCKDS